MLPVWRCIHFHIDIWKHVQYGSISKRILIVYVPGCGVQTLVCVFLSWPQIMVCTAGLALSFSGIPRVFPRVVQEMIVGG
jgi:hypothetical protein